MGFDGVMEKEVICMPFITKKFTKEIEVPDWELCNNHREHDLVNEWKCKFVGGTSDERYCNLFNKSLYSNGKRVKKCEDCLNACEVGHD